MLKLALILLTVSFASFGIEFPETKDYNSSLGNPVFATFWGGMRRALHWKQHKGEMVNLRLSRLARELPVYIQASKERRDLYLFYPGIFGKPDGKITPSMIDLLEKKDVHVAVIPNIVAPTYLVARPVSKDLDTEKLNQQMILSVVINRIGKDHIRNIHIIAESLGCFQALTALNDNDDINYESLILLWPPLYLDRAIVRFDDLIKKSVPQLNQCSLWWKWPLYVYEIKWQKRPMLEHEDKVCLGSWVIAEGFVESIRETAKIYFKSKSLPVDPLPATFSGFVKTVLPDMEPLISSKDERLSVVHLLKKIPKRKIKIVSSEDDFLNVPEEWEEVKKSYDVFLFPWGGHSGPLGIYEVAEKLISR